MGNCRRSKLKVYANGYVTFGNAYSSYTPTMWPSIPMVAPMWADIVLTGSDSMCYSVLLNNDPQLAVIANHLQLAGLTMQPTVAIVATWNNVSPYRTSSSDGTASFQLVLASTRTKTYAAFWYPYGKFRWSPLNSERMMLVGYTNASFGDRVVAQQNVNSALNVPTPYSLPSTAGDTNVRGYHTFLVGIASFTPYCDCLPGFTYIAKDRSCVGRYLHTYTCVRTDATPTVCTHKYHIRILCEPTVRE
jgi:hypothetical protein